MCRAACGAVRPSAHRALAMAPCLLLLVVSPLVSGFLPPALVPATARVSSFSHKDVLRLRKLTTLFSDRNFIEVRGLPRSSIMRTNSTAVMDFGPALLEPQFDFERSLPNDYEEELALPGASVLEVIKKLLPMNVITSAALISGCMIGAGVIALPSVTVQSGFMPSTATIAAVWAYCVGSSLLISEVCIKTRGAIQAASYLKIARATVGKELAALAFVMFTTFQYALLMAYISQGGNLLSHTLSSIIPSLHLNHITGPTAFASVIAAGVATLNARKLELVNTSIVAIVVSSFIALLFAGYQHMDMSLLTYVNLPALHQVVPVAMCALVFQNVVPLIAANLNFDRQKMMTALVLGSGVPALMYLAWNLMVLGNVPVEALGEHGLDLNAFFSQQGNMGAIFRVFGLSALVTSFIGCFLSVAEELAEFGRSVREMTLPSAFHPLQQLLKGVDAHSPEDGTPACKLPLYLTVLIPPSIAAVMFPGGFLHAIEASGGFGDPFLFGFLPVAMAWNLRYGRKWEEDEDQERMSMLPGGRVGLVAMAMITVGMLINKGADSIPSLMHMLGAAADAGPI